MCVGVMMTDAFGLAVSEFPHPCGRNEPVSRWAARVADGSDVHLPVQVDVAA